MTVADFLADRPDWLPEPTHTESAGASWALKEWKWATMTDCAEGVLCTWQTPSESGTMVTTRRDYLLSALRALYPPTLAEQLAALPRITCGSADPA